MFPARSSTIGCAFPFTTGARTALTFSDPSFINRIRTGTTGHRRLGIKNLAAINPNFHSDLTEGCLGLSKTVVNIRSQRMQWQLSLQVPLASGDFSTIQATANFHLDTLGAKTQRLFNGLTHRTSKRDTLFQLSCDLFSLQLGVQFRFVDFLDRDQHFTSGL